MNLTNWRKAGEIASQALNYGKTIIKEGASALEVANKIESKIRELGGEPAFPVNLSYNEFASHWIPKKNEELIFKDHVVNLDVGVHVEGCIGDCACTIDLSGKYTKLVESAKEALDEVEKILSKNPSIGEIGKVIQQTIEKYGYKPVANLSGHNLKEYEIHGGMSIPNVDTNDSSHIPPNTIVAIEPFATLGRGLIKESSNPQIYQQVKDGNVRSNIGREVLKEIAKYNRLPFAKRWLQTKGAELGIVELERANLIKSYPPLVDVDKKIVVQHERTYFISESGFEVLTKH